MNYSRISLCTVCMAAIFWGGLAEPVQADRPDLALAPDFSQLSDPNEGSEAVFSGVKAAHPLAASLMTVGVISATLGWGYYAWWYGKDLEPFHWRDTGFFGADTYAGGADKTGHFYAFYLGTYIFNDFYQRLGVRQAVRVPLSAGLTFLASNLIEFADAFTDFGFEYSDVIGNTLGVVLAMLDLYLPEFGNTVRFRLGWLPSSAFLEQAETYVDLINDYTGMTLYTDIKFKGVAELFGRTPGRLTRHLLAGINYNTEGYSPGPLPGQHFIERRNLGVHFGVYLPEWLRSQMQPGKGRKALETFSEFYAVPFTMLELKYDLNHGDVKAGFGASARFSVPF